MHRLGVTEAVASLDTDPQLGLSSAEAARRNAEFGPNVLPVESDGGALLRFLRQFHDPLVYVLMVAAIVTVSMAQFVDSGVIFGVVLLNAVIGYVQESRARSALDALARMVPAQAEVIRDGIPGKVQARGTGPW